MDRPTTAFVLSLLKSEDPNSVSCLTSVQQYRKLQLLFIEFIACTTAKVTKQRRIGVLG